MFWNRGPWLGQVPLILGPSSWGGPPAASPTVEPQVARIKANGGEILFLDGDWKFAMDPEALHAVGRALYPEGFSPVIRARIAWCNPTPPIVPSLGGFSHPRTGEYCQLEIPEKWQDAWTWRNLTPPENGV